MNPLLPKAGEQTSSYKVAIVSAIAPILLLLVIIVGLIFVDDAESRSILRDGLRYLVIVGIIGGAAIGYKYVDKRGDLAVAKIDAYKEAIKTSGEQSEDRG